MPFSSVADTIRTHGVLWGGPSACFVGLENGARPGLAKEPRGRKVYSSAAGVPEIKQVGDGGRWSNGTRARELRAGRIWVRWW